MTSQCLDNLIPNEKKCQAHQQASTPIEMIFIEERLCEVFAGL